MLERVGHSAREEKCFQSSISNCKKCQADTELRLALDRGVARNRSHQFLASENKGEIQAEENDVFNLTPLAIHNATMRREFDFHLLPLGTLVTQECEIENIFPHLSTQRSKEQLSQAWNIKS
jgi:hypothetical protein